MNFYTYTYPSYTNKALIKERNGIWIKFGDSIRDPAIRMAEQGNANEAEEKITVKTWLNVTTIERDYAVHAVFKKEGWKRNTN